ncbi:hypothetical protein CJJ07_002233 [Candidozyma auris]|nr:hypothetical protein CJJ07_002233 [[Candida] auris]QEL61076.1 hypothetical protein CJJ09_003212 [[Candida] auris]
MPKSTKKTTGYAQKSNPKIYKSPHYGGKNLKNFPYKRDRRFSIVSSSSSEYSEEKKQSDSDSESSLTALSEKDEQSASRKGSVFFRGEKLPRARAKAVGTKSSKAAKKRAPKKGPKASYAQVFDSDRDEEHSSDESVDPVGLKGIYSMMDANGSAVGDSESDSDDSSDSQEDASSDDSSDDSEVDFVRLQAERRANAKSKKSLKAVKALQKQNTEPETKKRRKSSYRRQSELPLPDNINFKFEFDENNDSVIEDDSEEDLALNVVKAPKPEEEDVGEEITDNRDDAKPSYNLNFQYDEPILDVPKINEEELQSDDDYEFDDNDLLATLQADNDIEDFMTNTHNDSETPRSRQRSVSSINEDETLDPFLEEEEKYLVNEFEMNGFDDENEFPAQSTGTDSSSGLKNQSQEEKGSNGDDDEESPFIEGYLEDDDDDDDVDEFMDLMDFSAPFFEDDSKESESSLSDLKSDGLEGSIKEKPNQVKSSKGTSNKKRRKPKGPLDSEEEDDSYLWNYFLSSDGDSDNETNTEPVDVEEQLILEEIFRQEKEAREGQTEREFSLEPLSEHEYDSGESTDVDTSLPPTLKRNQTGSKMAKEVLSSKTADYRPPVLGTWVAIESKPFSIIDGLSTRTLKSNQNAQKNPRTKGWMSIGLGNKTDHEDDAIELEELLNISELDNDDENDIRIWRDFNNRKKKVPLGAFRNKSHLHEPVHAVHEPMVNFSLTRMNNDFNPGRRNSSQRRKDRRNSSANEIQSNYNSMERTQHSQDSGVPKSKRRRASKADSGSEGYRSTKSGLFSANMLTDAEEVMGEDRDFIALIKGL